MVTFSALDFQRTLSCVVHPTNHGGSIRVNRILSINHVRTRGACPWAEIGVNGLVLARSECLPSKGGSKPLGLL
jgi:hypothetical protein